MADLPKKLFTPKSYDKRFPRYGRGTILLGHPVHVSDNGLLDYLMAPQKLFRGWYCERYKRIEIPPWL